MLTTISQSVGQINGTVFGCERWNVPALKNLQDQLQALIRGSGCQKGFIDEIEKGDEDGDGPLASMLETVQGVLEEYGLTAGGLEELEKATVSREEARDIVVLQLQTDWLNLVTQLTDFHGRSRLDIFDAEWPYQIPPAPSAVCLPATPSAYRWQDALMAARSWASETSLKKSLFEESEDAEWALGLIDSLLAGDVEKRVAELSWETRETGIQRQLRILLSHLDEWSGEDAEAAKTALRAVVTGESPARCTPSAEQHEFQEGIDPYIFLPLYWGARDRGEESFMYGGQQVLVAFARYLVEAAGWKDVTPEDLEDEQGTPSAWADMTPEEQERWRGEAEIRAAEARRQIETQLGREETYLDKDQWDIVMPQESLMRWTLPLPRGEFPHTPRLREGRQSIYNTPGWVKIRAYQVKNPHLTQKEIIKDTGYAQQTVQRALAGEGSHGHYYGPRLYAATTPIQKRRLATKAISPEVRAEAVQTYLERRDLTLDEIAEMFGVATMTIYSWIKEAGAELREPGILPEVRAEAVKAYVERSDLTVDEIAEMFGVSAETIYGWIKEAGGIKLRGRAHRFPEGQTPDAWADMTPEEQTRWREEAEIRSAEARKQIETQLGREEIYLDKDQWDVVMPQQSLMQWTLPTPRGEFPHTPRLRETRKSIYYMPGWVKIRAYQVKNPHLTVGQIAKDVGFSPSYVTCSLRGYGAKGEVYGPLLRAYRTPLTDKRFTARESVTPEIQGEMVQAYVDHPDLTVYEIAEMYGYSYPTLREWVIKAGDERRGSRSASLAFMSKEALLDLKANVLQAYTEHRDLEVAQIAEIYDITASTIYRWLRAAGIERTRRQPDQDPSAWADMTPDEQERWREEAEARSAEARKQIETQLGREMGYMDQDMWDVIMPQQSLMQWTLPWPRGDFPQTPLLRETRKSIYYAPTWVKIRYYQVKNPGLTVGQIAKDVGVKSSTVSHALAGTKFGVPRLHATRSEVTTRVRATRIERYGSEGGDPSPIFKAEVVQTYAEHPDLNITDLMEMYGVNRNTIKRWVDEAGVERRSVGAGYTTSPELLAEAIQVYGEHPELYVYEIAEMYGISTSVLYRSLQQAEVGRRAGQTPDAFVGFEGPFGFDDDITKESKDWIRYNIGSTPVVVRRVGAKPGVKLNPQYKGAGQPQELLLEFRLLASTRRDMEKINFLLERLREDNPTMTVNVRVKTDGKFARRSLPSWEDRPYRLEPSAFMGGMFTPEDYDPRIQEFKWFDLDPEAAEDSHYVDVIEHFGTDVTGEGLPTDEEMDLREDMDRSQFASGETSLAQVVWDIEDVKVEIHYGPWTSRLGERIEQAAYVSIERYGGRPFDSSMFMAGGEIAQVTDFLNQLQERNKSVRIVATAAGGGVEKGDLLARVYERYGWRRISGTDASGSVDMELIPPDKRTPSAFDGIAAYADDIIALV
jgi:transposase-like protein